MTGRWTAETATLVARTIFEPGGHVPSDAPERVLVALADAGLLLAPGGETREEIGTRIGNGDILTLAEAGTRYTISAQSRKVRTVWTGPWRDMPDGPWLMPRGEAGLDLLEAAWGIIANVIPWSGQNAEWQDAASRWRERYHEVLGIGGGP